MNTPESLNGMVSDLIRRGLPADYASRAAAEFADHHHDLVEELQATGFTDSQAIAEASHRLGDSRKLVKKTVREYQKRFWCARWPLITFLFGPIPLLVLAWGVTWLALFCIFMPLGKFGLLSEFQRDGTISLGEMLAEKAFLLLFGFVSPAAAMIALARLSRRAALNWKWLALSACVLGLSVGMLRSGFPEQAMRPTTMDGKPLLADTPMVTLGCPLLSPNMMSAWKWYTRDARQILQVVLPLAVVAFACLRSKVLSQRVSRLHIADR